MKPVLFYFNATTRETFSEITSTGRSCLLRFMLAVNFLQITKKNEWLIIGIDTFSVERFYIEIDSF